MWVVKIGGSLQNSGHLLEWLGSLLKYGSGEVVIVAGGGQFADAVRQSQLEHGFDDASAHKMALLAMEQFAHLLTGLLPGLQAVTDIKSIHACLADRGIAVWLPYKMVVAEAAIPASWDVTADGLAAWLALRLQTRSLILVKSIRLPGCYSGYTDLAERGFIDPFMPRLLVDASLDILWMQKQEWALLPAIFNNKLSPAERQSILLSSRRC